MEKNKLERKIHDAWTVICQVTGPHLSYDNGDSLPYTTLAEGEKVKIDNAWEHSIDQSSDSVSYATTKPFRVYRLNNIMLSGDRAHVFLDPRTLLAVDSELKYENKTKIRRPIRWLSRTINEPIFHLGGTNHENHGHFITQFLPRALASIELFRNIPDMRILVAPNHKYWQTKYLSYLGIPPERIIEGTAGTLFCKNLYYCPLFHGSNDLVQPHLYEQLQNRFIKDIQHVKGQTEIPVIFISRSDAPDRRLKNEDRLIEILENTLGNVTIVHLAKLSLEKQIKLLGRARWVVAPQGQGLATTLFTNKTNVVILESLQPPSGQRDWATSFRDLAIYSGNRAVRLYAGIDNTNKGDWSFPEELFQKYLIKLIKALPYS